MNQAWSIDKSKHLQRISEAMEELVALHPITAAPAPEPIQYIGTIADNTVGLLATAANSLDGGCRHLVFESERNWLSLMTAVHRSFVSGVHSALERALAHICEERGIEIRISAQRRVKKLAKSLEGKLTQDERKKIESLAPKAPSFSDYLEAVLSISQLKNDRKVMWRRYLVGLSLIRNKVSHSDPSLTSAQVEELKKAGFGTLVSTGELLLNPRSHRQICDHLIQFLREVLDSLPVTATVQQDSPKAE